MEQAIVYADGAFNQKSKVGAWAATVYTRNGKQVISGRICQTDIASVELAAIVKALESLKHPTEVAVFTDQLNIVSVFEQGLIGKRSKKKCVQKQLWCRLLELSHYHKVTFAWVKGHSENVLHNEVDLITRKKAKGVA